MAAFSPRILELVCDFLKNKILGQPVHEALCPTFDDAYSKSPDQLLLRIEWYYYFHTTTRQSVYEHESFFYFHTTRPSDSKLVTDDGYYTVFTEENVLRGNQHVGFKRILIYYLGLPPNGKKTNWIIHEFRLNPDIIPASQLDDSAREKIPSFVVCKIIPTEGDTKKYSEGEVGLLDSLFKKAAAVQKEKENQ